MKHITTALPSTARDALHLADDPRFAPWWADLQVALLSLGERAANFAEARDAYDAGWSPDGAAHEIADKRVDETTSAP